MRARIKNKGYGTTFPDEGVEYEVKGKVSSDGHPDYGRSFWLHVKGESIFCLENDCAHLNSGDWELIEDESDNTDNDE